MDVAAGGAGRIARYLPLQLAQSRRRARHRTTLRTPPLPAALSNPRLSLPPSSTPRRPVQPSRSLRRRLPPLPLWGPKPAPWRSPPPTDTRSIDTAPKGYWETLRAVRAAILAGPHPDAVTAARRGRDDSLILDMKYDASVDTALEVVTPVAGQGNVKVTNTGGKVLELKFLDPETTPGQIVEAIDKALGTVSGIKVVWVRDYTPTLRVALLEGSPAKMTDLLAVGALKFGWLQCPLAERLAKPPQCTGCRALGHGRASCTGPHVTGLCLRCGAPGHDSEGCTAALLCLSCSRLGVENGHFTGSKNCGSFRLAASAALPSNVIS